MAFFKNKFDSIKQDWNTPKSLFDKLNDEFNFKRDLAATSENSLCSKYYTKENDGLKQEWVGVCWLNPPYGDKSSKMVDFDIYLTFTRFSLVLVGHEFFTLPSIL